jgi:hypothetical protein
MMNRRLIAFFVYFAALILVAWFSAPPAAAAPPPAQTPADASPATGTTRAIEPENDVELQDLERFRPETPIKDESQPTISNIIPTQPECTPVRVAFDKNYQKKIAAFSARKLPALSDYFTGPYVAAGAKTPLLEDVLFEFTHVINPIDLLRISAAFKQQTLRWTKNNAWNAQELRRAIDTGARFDVCLPIPAYAKDPAPIYRFMMNKKDLLLYMYQMVDGKDVLLTAFPTTKGGAHYDATSGEARGFGTPSGQFFVKRIVYAPAYTHPDWSRIAGHTEPPGFGNSYGIVMAELWTTPNPFCKAGGKVCNGYQWNYPGGTGIRFHTSNKDTNVRRADGRAGASHGCNRLLTRDGKRIFTLLYYNIPHAPCKKNTRGTVCPFFDSVLNYRIVEK